VSVLYYINGDRASAAEAKRLICLEAQVHGYEPENWDASWSRRGSSEAAREFLCEITGHQLEIEVQ